MKKVKSLNGYSIFEAGPRDVDKYGYEAGAFYVFFSRCKTIIFINKGDTKVCLLACP